MVEVCMGRGHAAWNNLLLIGHLAAAVHLIVVMHVVREVILFLHG